MRKTARRVRPAHGAFARRFGPIAVSLVAALGLVACGGSDREESYADLGSGPSMIGNVDFTEVIERAAVSSPVFGSVLQSTNGFKTTNGDTIDSYYCQNYPNCTNAENAPLHLVFHDPGNDWRRLSTFSHEQYSVDTGSNRDRVDPAYLITILDNHDETFWQLMDTSPEGRTIVSEFVESQNRDDIDEYVVFGYWASFDGPDDGGEIDLENAWAGVFVDGPEFDELPSSLPATGKATYSGPAFGVYTRTYSFDRYHDDISMHADGRFHELYDGTVEIAQALGKVTLNVSFATSLLGGFIENIFLNTTATHPPERDGPSLEHANQVDLDYLVRLRPTTIAADGTFVSDIGTGIDIEGQPTEHYPHMGEYKGTHWDAEISTDGTWGGRFSSLASGGNPRLVGGTAAVVSTYSYPVPVEVDPQPGQFWVPDESEAMMWSFVGDQWFQDGYND